MIHKAKQTEELWIFSMGKRFRVMAIADTDDEANAYCAAHDEAAVIACFGPLVIMASKYAGVRDPARQAELSRMAAGPAAGVGGEPTDNIA